MPRKSFPLSKAYGLLEPGPVVLLSTYGRGRANVMAQSWHTMLEFEPPLVGAVVSNRNYTFGLLKSTRECVINIPTVELAEKVVICGNRSGREVDKLALTELTPLDAAKVSAPLIAECYANLECRVADTRMVNRYCLFVLEVIKAWVDASRENPRTIHHLGQGRFMASGRVFKLPSRAK